MNAEIMGSGTARASGDDTLAHCIKNEFRNAVDIELLQDMATMSFNGCHADIQQICDFLVGAPLGNHL